MQTDKTTKLILALIALALLLNAFVPLLQPPVVEATTEPELSAEAEMQEIVELRSIADTLRSIANGNCRNRILCGR